MNGGMDMDKRMKQCINEIAEKYKHIMDFQKNDKYSREQTVVYVAPDQDHWLSVEVMDKNFIQARLSDDKGIIKQWDDYSILDGKIKLNKSVKAPEKVNKSLSARIEKARSRADKNNRDRAERSTRANEKGYASLDN